MRVRVGHEFECERERQAWPWKQDVLGQLACSLTPGRHQGSVSGAGPVRPGVQGGCQIRRTLAQMTREWSSYPQTHRSPGTLLFASWDSGAPWRGHPWPRGASEQRWTRFRGGDLSGGARNLREGRLLLRAGVHSPDALGLLCYTRRPVGWRTQPPSGPSRPPPAPIHTQSPSPRGI